MDWVLGLLAVLGLVTTKILLRRSLLRRWLAGELTVNQMAAAIALTGGAGIATLVVAWEILVKGAEPWLLLIPAIALLLVYPFARWVVVSFFPAPARGEVMLRPSWKRSFARVVGWRCLRCHWG